MAKSARKQAVTVALGMLVVVGCILIWRGLRSEARPPDLVVGTIAPGSRAKTVADVFTRPITRSIAAMRDVAHVEAVSRDGGSFVYIWLAPGAEGDETRRLLMEQIAGAVSGVPKSLGAMPPFLVDYDPATLPSSVPPWTARSGTTQSVE